MLAQLPPSSPFHLASLLLRDTARHLCTTSASTVALPWPSDLTSSDTSSGSPPPPDGAQPHAALTSAPARASSNAVGSARSRSPWMDTAVAAGIRRKSTGLDGARSSSISTTASEDSLPSPPPTTSLTSPGSRSEESAATQDASAASKSPPSRERHTDFRPTSHALPPSPSSLRLRRSTQRESTPWTLPDTDATCCRVFATLPSLCVAPRGPTSSA
mmetsp:Transcript_7602/g.26139  ORF Transcript_7602/g.26139 Transcript_7602/m.26139 type:complete len:216 (+) Transcript_7602:307-954(+)